MRIDLHTHSTVSDGTLTPAEVMSAGGAAGLDVVALTDHDTTTGWAEAAAALPAGLTLVAVRNCPAVGTTAAGGWGYTCWRTCSTRLTPRLRRR